MRFLLVQPPSYRSQFVGVSNANRSFVDCLRAANHTCAVATLAPQSESEICLSSSISADPDVYEFGNLAAMARGLPRLIEEFRPDWVAASEDSTLSLLAMMLRLGGVRVCYIAHGAVSLPIGPHGFIHDPTAGELLRRADVVVTVSQWLKEYIFSSLGLSPIVVTPPIRVPRGPLPVNRSLDDRAVTMVNASRLKGLPVLLDLAALLPDVRFAAVTGWATTSDDVAAMRRFPNIEILGPADINHFLERSSALLVPSLVPEGLGLTVIEAMSRGVPVLASDRGALPEAKLGVDYVLPVPSITFTEALAFDERGNAEFVVQEDASSSDWRDAIDALRSCPEQYAALSAQSLEAARAFIGDIEHDAFERTLLRFS